MLSLEKELKENSYPGRGIVIGRSADGKKAVTAYFIMGRSENSRNRVFVEDGEGIRTQAFDPSKLTDPSLIIYAPVGPVTRMIPKGLASIWLKRSISSGGSPRSFLLRVRFSFEESRITIFSPCTVGREEIRIS